MTDSGSSVDGPDASVPHLAVSDPLSHYPTLRNDHLSTEACKWLPIGNRTLVSLSDGFFQIDGVRNYLGTAANPTAAYDHLAARHGRVRMPIGCFLLPGTVNTLIDVGVGPHDDFNGMLVGGNLINQLRHQGFQPEDIDVIALSHLHPDHTGCLADRDGNPVFPRARVYLGAADWKYFVEPSEPVRGIVERIRLFLLALAERGQVVLLDGDTTFVHGITRLAGPGHTPGHSLFAISDGDDRALLFGDAMYCPAQLTNLDWECIGDLDRDLARQTREKYLSELDTSGDLAVGCHFPGLQAGRVLSGQWSESL